MMKTGMWKNAMALGMAVLLGVAAPCPSLWAQAQSTSQSSGQSQGLTSNPYIQSTPQMTGGGLPSPSLLGTGQQDSSAGGAANIFYPDIKTYVMVAGDVINVRLYGTLDFATTLRLSKDGTGQLPLIGDMALAGMTIEKAQILIEDKLKSAGMYRNPHITITLSEFDESQSTITLAGEMHGRLPSRRARTVAEALNAAGGLPLGSSPVVSIIRPGSTEQILVDMGTTGTDMAKANVPLQPGDTIFVQRAGAVYVVGAFKTPGVFAMQPARTTLLQVAALSGGPLYSAKYQDMRIIRTVESERTEVKVDIQKVLFGSAPDPILQPGDIIFLPTSPLKAALSSGGVSVLLGLMNAALIVATR